MKFLFDLGGVFFDWNPEHFYKSIIIDPEERLYFLSNVCNDNWNILQDSGRSIKEGEAKLISEFPKYEKYIKMYYVNHRNMIRRVYSESVKILTFLKKNYYKSYVLSNWSAETFKGMTVDYPFLTNFDGMIISGEVKLIKPDPAIYDLAINRFNLIPKETIFIDDKIENIETAKNIGFNVIHLTNPNAIREQISNYIKIDLSHLSR